MNEREQQPADPLRERLVAYLDGELDPESASRLEDQMATDPQLREEKNRLERAWDLLDYLPRAETDEAFTQSTMEMVALSAQAEVRLEQDMLPRLRRRRLLLGSGGVLAAGLAGFLAVSRLSHDPNEQLLQDLPVLQKMEQYRQVDNLQFLELLDQKNLFPDEEPQDDV